MTATIIKNVLVLRYLEASLPFRLLLSNNSLVTSLHCQTPRLLTRLWHWQKGEKKESDYVVWTIQFDSFSLVEFSSSINFLCVLSLIQGCVNSVPFNSFLSFCFSLCLSEHSHLTAALPISSTRHSLTTSTPHSAGPTGTHTNSVCLSSPDGHGIGKRDG